MRLAYVRTWIVAAMAAAGVAAPAMAATRDLPLRGFDAVDLAASATVNIHSGRAFAVHVDGDRELVDWLDPVVDAGVLHLRWRPGTRSISTGNRRLTIDVSLPRLARVAVSGAGAIAIDHVEGPRFGAEMSGAGSVNIANLRSRQAMLTVGGTGSIVAAGTTGRLDARVSGVGSIDARALAAREGQIAMSGTGSIKTRVDGAADVTLSGIGSVLVVGGARCTIHKSGLGSVHCGK